MLELGPSPKCEQFAKIVERIETEIAHVADTCVITSGEILATIAQ